MPAFTNQAILFYDNRTALSNIASGNISDPYAITVRAVNDDYIFGDDVTFVMTITNTSGTPLTNLRVTDDLGTYSYGTAPLTLYPLTFVGPILHYRNGNPRSNIIPVSTSPTLEFVVPSVPGNGNVMLIYEASINQYAPLDIDDSVISHVAAPSLFGITAEEEIFTDDAPLLSISKSISPDPVIDNQTATFTFIISNSGNTESNDVIFTDTFLPVLTDLTVSVDDSPLTPVTDYTYDADSGLLTILSGHLTVPEATFNQADDGVVTTTPGFVTVVVTGTV